MSQTYGIEAADQNNGARPRDNAEAPSARYLVLIDSASAGRRLGRVLLASREPVAEFDASAPEVQLMTRGLAAQSGAADAQWDAALSGHSGSERDGAEIYLLDA